MLLEGASYCREVASAGSEDWNDRVRHGYDAASYAYRRDDDDPPEYRRWCSALHSRLGRPSTVLDLGCGCGVPVALRLARLGHHITGVDMSEVQVQRAHQLVPEGTFICGNLCEVEFGDAAFDAVVFLYAIIHVPVDRQATVLSKIATWLRPGGVLLLTAGAQAWTGAEDGWLGTSATMLWSQADAPTYARWLQAAGLVVGAHEVVPDGASSHSLFWAHRPEQP